MARKRPNGASYDPRQFITWSIDYWTNAKTRGLPPSAKTLDQAAVALSYQQHSDGLIVPEIAVVTAGPGVTRRDIDRLVAAGRWHKPGHRCERCAQPPAGFVRIHDYDQHQRTAAEYDEITSKRSSAGVAGNHRRWGHPGRVEDCQRCNSDRPEQLRVVQ